MERGEMPARHGIDLAGDQPSQCFRESAQTMIMEEVTGSPGVMVSEWVGMDLEVALDSGCCDLVMDTEMCAPGYEVHESEGSRRGAAWKLKQNTE